MNTINWNLLGLETNPFGIIPDIENQKIVWAGFTKVKNAYETIIANTLSSSSSNIILSLSRWGGGKTHASVYFSQTQNFHKPEGVIDPFNIFVITPKEGSSGSTELFIKIVESIGIQTIRSLVTSLKADLGNDGLKVLQSWAASEDLGKIVWLIADDDEDVAFKAEQMLFGVDSLSIKNKLKIRRGIVSLSDKFQIISLLMKLLSMYTKEGKIENKRRVFLWIDELESLIYYTSKQFRPLTQALRWLIDNTPNYLTIFMNFSFSEPTDIQNIEFVIGSALLDRITEKIIINEASEFETIEYVEQLLKLFRLKDFNKQSLFPFNANSLGTLLATAPKQTGLPLLPRTINKWCLYAIKEANISGYFSNENIKEIDEKFVENLNFSNAIE